MKIEIRHPSAHREIFQTIWLNDAFCYLTTLLHTTSYKNVAEQTGIKKLLTSAYLHPSAKNK